jgi:hypothetical protein
MPEKKEKTKHARKKGEKSKVTCFGKETILAIIAKKKRSVLDMSVGVDEFCSSKNIHDRQTYLGEEIIEEIRNPEKQLRFSPGEDVYFTADTNYSSITYIRSELFVLA